MKCLNKLFLISLTVGIAISGVCAQSLQKGVSVHLPGANNATAAPNADSPEALIVTITREGNVYIGIDPTHYDLLADIVKREQLNHSERNSTSRQMRMLHMPMW